MKLRFLTLTLLCIALTSTVSWSDVAKDRTVILISVDGLADYYFDDENARMPTIREMAAQGARAKRMEGSFPTVTWPNHTTLVTGVHPAKHGVIGNNYFDREQEKTIPLIPDPLFDKDEIVTSPTVYDVAHEAGLKTAGVIWPASRNAATLNWQIPDVFDQEIFESNSTKSLLAELRGLNIPYWRQMEWCKGGNEGKAKRDVMYTQIAQHILRTHQPNLLLLHLVTVDGVEHAYGRQVEDVYIAIEFADQCIRKLQTTIEEAGLADRTTFFICADHGFITYTKQILPNVVLRQAGLRDGQGVRLEQKAYALAQGGGCFIYLLDGIEDREAAINQLAERFSQVEGVEVVIKPEEFAKYGHQLPEKDPRVPDLMLSAADGYSFSGKDSGDAVIEETNGPKGSHGYSPFHPLMGANFVASGAGIKEGVELDQISATDVAPTIARLLGVEMKNVEGRVLEEILAE